MKEGTLSELRDAVYLSTFASVNKLFLHLLHSFEIFEQALPHEIYRSGESFSLFATRQLVLQPTLWFLPTPPPAELCRVSSLQMAAWRKCPNQPFCASKRYSVRRCRRQGSTMMTTTLRYMWTSRRPQTCRRYSGTGFLWSMHVVAKHCTYPIVMQDIL